MRRRDEGLERVKNYAAMGITSIIHGKATHEETSATASRALGERGRGKYLVVYDWRMPVSCATTSWAAETARHS